MYFLSGYGDDVSVDYGPGAAGPRPAENLTDLFSPPTSVTALPAYARLGSNLGRNIRAYEQQGQDDSIDVDYGPAAAGPAPVPSVNAGYPIANATTAAPYAMPPGPSVTVPVAAPPCSLNWWPKAAPAPKSALGWLLVGLAGGFVAAKILK